MRPRLTDGHMEMPCHGEYVMFTDNIDFLLQPLIGSEDGLRSLDLHAKFPFPGEPFCWLLQSHLSISSQKQLSETLKVLDFGQTTMCSRTLNA